MGLALFIIFAGIVLLGLHLWLLVNIWQISPIGAILTFLFWPVSIYFLITNWNNEEANIKTPFFASFIGYMLVFGIIVSLASSQYAEQAKKIKAAQQTQKATGTSNAAMDEWCKKQDGAVFNTALGTCVEAPFETKKNP